MIPMHKVSGSMSDLKNYRGIALSIVHLSKLCDICTCNISNQFDSVFSNNLQFHY